MIDERTIATAEPAALPSILGDLERLKALAWSRLTVPLVAPVVEPADEMLDAAGVAAILNIKPEQVRRLAALRPYRRRLSAQVHRYSKAGVLRLVKRS